MPGGEGTTNSEAAAGRAFRQHFNSMTGEGNLNHARKAAGEAREGAKNHNRARAEARKSGKRGLVIGGAHPNGETARKLKAAPTKKAGKRKAG